MQSHVGPQASLHGFSARSTSLKSIMSSLQSRSNFTEVNIPLLQACKKRPRTSPAVDQSYFSFFILQPKHTEPRTVVHPLVRCPSLHAL